jgi:hypothetical protein
MKGKLHILLLIALTIGACHRKDLLDKRHKYIGNWQFTSSELTHHWTQNPTTGIWSDNSSSSASNYGGYIDYGVNANDLQITFDSKQSVNTSNYTSDHRKKIHLSFTLTNEKTNTTTDYVINGIKE